MQMNITISKPYRRSAGDRKVGKLTGCSCFHAHYSLKRSTIDALAGRGNCE